MHITVDTQVYSDFVSSRCRSLSGVLIPSQSSALSLPGIEICLDSEGYLLGFNLNIVNAVLRLSDISACKGIAQLRLGRQSQTSAISRSTGSNSQPELNHPSRSLQSAFIHPSRSPQSSLNHPPSSLTLILDNKLDYSYIKDSFGILVYGEASDSHQVNLVLNISELADKEVVRLLYSDINFLRRYVIVGDTDEERLLQGYATAMLYRRDCSTHLIKLIPEPILSKIPELSALSPQETALSPDTGNEVLI